MSLKVLLFGLSYCIASIILMSVIPVSSAIPMSGSISKEGAPPAMNFDVMLDAIFLGVQLVEIKIVAMAKKKFNVLKKT
jgi:hypothetical protein